MGQVKSVIYVTKVVIEPAGTITWLPRYLH
jgi:hypothetical protein